MTPERRREVVDLLMDPVYQEHGRRELEGALLFECIGEISRLESLCRAQHESLEIKDSAFYVMQDMRDRWQVKAEAQEQQIAILAEHCRELEGLCPDESGNARFEVQEKRIAELEADKAALLRIIKEWESASERQDSEIEAKEEELLRLRTALRSVDPWIQANHSPQSPWMCSFCRTIQPTHTGSHHKADCTWNKIQEAEELLKTAEKDGR